MLLLVVVEVDQHTLVEMVVLKDLVVEVVDQIMDIHLGVVVLSGSGSYGNPGGPAGANSQGPSPGGGGGGIGGVGRPTSYPSPTYAPYIGHNTHPMV